MGKPESRGFGRWRKGFPLPPALRDTGVESHCAVSINSTHKFLGGGYARNYDFTDTVKNDQRNDEEDADLDIAKEGASIRTSADQKPICNSEDHKANTTCQRPICNSESHEKVGLDQDCNPICNSEEHKAIGLQKECSISRAPDVRGTALNKAWMYDGQTSDGAVK